MAHVNLLPWREKQRQHQKQQYLAGLLAVAAIVGLIFWFIGQAIAPIVFDELAKLVPPGVAFETMTRTNNRIEIEGVSDSNNRLSDFMRALENSKVFVAAELSTIKSDSSTARAISNFTLTFSINTNVAPLEVESSEAQK